ncbi:hypothetical protein Tco_1279863, partial [Tanacetum coccineum]
ESTSLIDVMVTIIAEPPLLSTTTLPPPPTPFITHLQQTPIPTPSTAPSSSLQDLPNFGSLFGFDHRLKTLEIDFSELKQTNQFATVVSLIPDIVDAYLANKMHEAIKTVNLYKALVDANESDKLILDTYRETVSFKRRRDEEDKDEEPSIGSNQGSERRRAGKEPESTSAPKEKTSKIIGKSTKGSKSYHKSADESTQAEEPISLAQMKDPPGPTFELMKGSCKSLVELEYFFEEVYKATTGQLDWKNPEANNESAQDVYSKRRIIIVTKLQIVEWHNYKHLDWITVHRDDDKLYTFKEGDFNRLRIQDIEDMLLLLVQGNLTNLTVEERLAFNNKDKKNRLMRIDELHKFSDGTLNDVRTALDDRLKGIWMKYLPQTIWRQSDRDKAGAMIQAIDKQLKTRRIMRRLEKFVGGRPYEGDFWLLQRTI